MSSSGSTPAGWYPNPEGPGERYWDGASWTDQMRASAATEYAAPATPPTPQTPQTPQAPGAYQAPGGAYQAPAEAYQPPGYAAAGVGAAAGGGVKLGAMTLSNGMIAAGVGAFLLLISTILPWISADAFGSSETGTSFDKDAPWLLTGGDITELDEGTFGWGFLFLIIAIVAIVYVVRAAMGGGDYSQAAMVALICGGVAFLLILISFFTFGSQFGDFNETFGEDVLSRGWGMWVGLLGALALGAGGFLMQQRK